MEYTNEFVLDKIKTERTTQPSPIKKSSDIKMPWEGRIDNTEYSIPLESVYDINERGIASPKFKNYIGATGNEDRLAKQQSAMEQVGNGLWKNLQKTGLYALDGINTFTYGIYSGISEGSLKGIWDNDISNYLDEQSKKLDRDFANYYTDEEKSKDFFGRMFSNPANFLANDVAGGLAFVAGAVLPELALGVLTGGASAPVSFGKMLAKSGLKQAVKSADNIAGAFAKEGVEQAVKKGVKNATFQQSKNSLSALSRAQSVGAKRLGDVTQYAKFIGKSVLFEAGMEARHNFHNSIDTYMNDFQEREGRLPSQEELGLYIEDAGKSADYVFLANTALLSVTNAAMFGKMFNLPTMNLDTKIGKAFGIDITKLPTGKMVMKNATKAQKVAGNTYFLAKKPFSEGVVEEGLQGVFGGTMDNYLKTKYDPNQTDVSLMASFGEALKDQYTTKEGWFEIGIGGIIGMIGGNVSGDFGVEGIGKKGYGGARKTLEGKVDNYNTQTERVLHGKLEDGAEKSFKGLIRSNSVMNYKVSEATGLDATPAFQDTVVNYNYIKANENLKDYTNTVEDFNASVDLMEFTPEQRKEFGFKHDSQVESYKQSLKDNFKNDYDLYQEVESIVENLQLPNYSEGDLTEFKEAVEFSLMAGKKAGVEGKKIMDNLSQITGINGLYDAKKFQQEMDESYNNNIQLLKEKQERLNTLKDEIISVGQRLEESKGNEALYKENAKQHSMIVREMKTLTDETAKIEATMEEDFVAMQSNITFTPSEYMGASMKDVIEKVDGLDAYIQSLKDTGRTEEAKNIEILKEQFNLYTSAEINANNSIRRMYETDFYKSKEGKGLLNKVRGKDYSMTSEVKDEINGMEDSVKEILVKNGFEWANNAEVVEERLKNNPNLSEREKFKMESMYRTILAYRRIQTIIDDASKEQKGVEDSIAKDFGVEGDTISVARNLRNADLTNPEELNEIIKAITKEIDEIVNKPTAENLRAIKAKEEEIEQLKQQILDIQNRSQEEVLEEVPTTNSEVDKTPEQVLIESLEKGLESVTGEFKDEELANIIREQLESLTEQEVDEVINEIEQEDENETTSDRQVESNVPTDKTETKEERIKRLDGKQVSINGKIGKLRVINDNRVELEDGDTIYEFTNGEIKNINGVEENKKYDVTEIGENSVKVNNVDYTINLDEKGNVESLSPRNSPQQRIKNESLLVAVEIERNKLEYQGNEDSNIIENIKNNYPNLNTILDNVWATNMTDTISEALDKMYSGETLTEQESLQVALWLQDVFDRISILYKKENSVLEKETLLKAYDTANTLNEILYQLNNTKVEGYDNTRTNDANTRGEANTDTNDESGKTTQGETIKNVQTPNAEVDAEKQIQEITQSIQQLEDEIAELKVPFRFMDSEGYKKYNNLLQKKINTNSLTPQENKELEDLERAINQWITITGARVQGIQLSDLIKQLQALENTPVISDPDVGEVTDEEMVEDAKEAEDSVRNNYSTGLSYNAVVSRRTKDSVVINNISLKSLEEASGVKLEDVDGVEETATGGIRIPHNIVEEINGRGNVAIVNPATDETSTYYALVLQTTTHPITGEFELTPLESDYDMEDDGSGNKELYEEGVINPDTIFNSEKGDEVLVKIDPNHPHNKKLFDKLKKETGFTKPLTEEEIREEIEKITQEKANKNKTVINIQSEIAQIQSKSTKTTDDTARIRVLESRLKKSLKEIRDVAEDVVLKRKEKKPKKPSAELINEFIKNFRLMVVTAEEGNNLQILKGIRTADGYEGTDPHFEALRIKLLSDPIALLTFVESNNSETIDEPITIKKILMGLPNYNYTKNEDGRMVRQNIAITNSDLNKIDDIGYVQNGKLVLRSGRKKEDGITEDYVKSALKKNSPTKVPVVIIKRGKALIAYPVKVGRDASPIDLDSFKNIYNSETISVTDKAIRLNTMLAEAGIDVRQKGNAFIALEGEALNDEFFNNIFAELENKEYIRSVDSWVDPKKPISESLLNNASINIRLSNPFISPKIVFDFSKIELQEVPETKKESTKKAVVDNKSSLLEQFRCK